MNRWIYSNPDLPSEAKFKKEIIEKIDRWWSAFSQKTQELNDCFTGKTKWDVSKWMSENLHAIDPKLMYEFGPAIKGPGHRLVITPEIERHLRPLVNTILELAPKFNNWEFYPYRLPDDFKRAVDFVKSRTGGDITKLEVSPSIGEDNIINLNFHSVGTSDSDTERIRNDTFIATESLLGEEILDKWIGPIDITHHRKHSSLFSFFKVEEKIDYGTSIETLKPAVDQLLSELQSKLPDKPCYTFIEDAKWIGWKQSPQKAADYPQRKDIFTGISGMPGMMIALSRGRPFYSECFSKCHEIFCYVKIDGTKDSNDPCFFSDREEIEKSLDSLLIPADAGCVIGGATGLRYSYVDLALTKLTEGINIVCNVLRKGNVSRRAWILFFDACLAAEWVGIYSDTPEPPS